MKDFNNIEMLFKEHYPALVLYANKIVCDKHSAEDIVQSLFLKFMERKNREEINIQYLYKSVKNSAIDHINGVNRSTVIDNIPNIASEEIDIEEEREYANQLQEINSAIEELPEMCREIFKAVYFTDKKYADVAKEMNLSLSTIKTQMYRAIKRLRGNFDTIFLFLLNFCKDFF